jgi:oxygen-dependent protoporphyrinogen oxidase
MTSLPMHFLRNAKRRKDILKSYTMQRGLGSITHAIAREKAIEFRTDMPVESIVESKGSYLVSSKGESFECGYLAICAALPAVPGLLKGIDGTLAKKVSKIQYRLVESLGIIIKKDATDIKLFAGLVPTDDHFFQPFLGIRYPMRTTVGLPSISNPVL